MKPYFGLSRAAHVVSAMFTSTPFFLLQDDHAHGNPYCFHSVKPVGPCTQTAVNGEGVKTRNTVTAAMGSSVMFS